MEFTMYILINKDLQMGKGKIASQSAHATHIIVHDILTKISNRYFDLKVGV